MINIFNNIKSSIIVASESFVRLVDNIIAMLKPGFLYGHCVARFVTCGLSWKLPSRFLCRSRVKTCLCFNSRTS